MSYRVLRDARTSKVVLPKVRWCASYWCHLRGLQFRSGLPDGEGLLFVTQAESIPGTSIHMFNVFFSIAVIWLDANGRVVDKKLAKPFRPFYAPREPAQYYLEANPAVLDAVQIGDRLDFSEVVQP